MKYFWITILALFLVSGTSWGAGYKEGTGTLIGAGAGALIGSQIGDGSGRVAAMVIGTLAGAMVGQGVGRSLDRADMMTMQYSSQRALETSRTNYSTPWVNPDSGHSGSLTPIRTYQNNTGQYCREYLQTVTIGGEQQQAYGTACRQADGSWQIAMPAQQVRVEQVTRVRYVPTSPYNDYGYRYPYGYPYGYGYYNPVRVFLSLGYYGHRSGHGHGHRSHFSGHRSHGGKHRGVFHSRGHGGGHHKGSFRNRGHGGRGSGHGSFRTVGHRRGHR